MKLFEILNKVLSTLTILVAFTAGVVNWITDDLDSGVGYMAFGISVLALLIATEERG